MCQTGEDQEVCVSVLGLQCSMADVSAAGMELPDGITVAISSPGFFMYNMHVRILSYYFCFSLPTCVLGFIDRSSSILPDDYAIFKT